MPQNEVVTLPRPQRELAPQTYSFAEIERLADYIAKSRLFGLTTREQAIVMMSIAQAEGRHPAQAAKDYNVIQGRPSKTAEAMQRDFMQSGGRIQWHDLSDDVASATFSHPQGGSIRILWDMSRAAKAGLNSKDMWKKYPRQMLRARCVSEGVKTIYPAATGGFYTPEEVRDMPAMALPADMPSDTTEALNQFAAIVGETEPPPVFDLFAETQAASERGPDTLLAFWDTLSPADKRALKPHLEAYKAIAARAAKTADDPFGLPPIAPPEQQQAEPPMSQPDAGPAPGPFPSDAGQPFAEGDVFSQLDHEAKAATKDGMVGWRKWSKTLSRDDRDLILHMFPEYEQLARDADAQRGLAL